MSYSFSIQSKAKLLTCDQRLQVLFNKVIKYIDITVIYGHRSNETQNKLFEEGKSQKKAGGSKHNAKPSMAIDVAPYPINWEDTARFYYLAGIVKGIAWENNIPIRWGGDWNMNNNLKDQSFNDLGHFELI